MELNFYNDTNFDLFKYEEIYLELFNQTLLELNKSDNYICSITFISKENIHEINFKYRLKDSPTDVISFAFLDDVNEASIKYKEIDLGEIYISYEVAQENAKKYQNSIERELSFLFVHGLLHLFGYDHMSKKDEEIMFPLQEKILNRSNLWKKKD